VTVSDISETNFGPSSSRSKICKNITKKCEVFQKKNVEKTKTAENFRFFLKEEVKNKVQNDQKNCPFKMVENRLKMALKRVQKRV